MSEPINVSELVTSFYSELKTVAADLNAVSDELGKSISQIDAALKNLNLGITVWISMREGHGDQQFGDTSFWAEDIGYAKHGNRWGICLRQIEGDYSNGREDVEMWLFNDAPRVLRLTAIDHFVGLLKKLSEEGVATTQKIREKLADAQEVAAAVTKASHAPRKGFVVKGARVDERDGWIRAAESAAAAINVDGRNE